MGKVLDRNYYQISGWMVNKLKLKGNELHIFGIIYGFSQDGENQFTGSLNYLSDWISSSRQTVIKTLKELEKKNYILKEQYEINNVKLNKYCVNLNYINELIISEGSQKIRPPVKNLDGGSQKNRLGVVKKLDGGSQKIRPNNYIYNKDINKITTTTDLDEEITDVIAYYANLNPRCTPLEIEMLSDDVKLYSAKWVKEAIKIAIKRGKFNLGYAEAILKSWKANGYEDGEKNDSTSQSKSGMVRQKYTRYKSLYSKNKVETTEEARDKFANEQSGWD